VLLQDASILDAESSFINSNSAPQNGGGLEASYFCVITLREGSSASSNSAGRGGGIFLENSSLDVIGSVIDSNVVGGTSDEFIVSGGTGGGVQGVKFSIITLSHGASVSHNTAIGGGGAFLHQSTLNVISSSSISNNVALRTGGGVVAIFESSMTLGDSTSIAHNSAQAGGGLDFVASTLTITGHASVCSNVARDSQGGGILTSSKSTIRLLGSGDLTLCNNTAMTHGGACALWGASLLIDSEDSSHTHQPGTRSRLTVRDNTAIGEVPDEFSNGIGGGLLVSGDSTVNLGATVVVISRNVAAQQGGGLYIGGSEKAEATGSLNATECSSTERIVFWRLDLVDNRALAGDGGGLYSANNILLRPGGQTNATGNTAGNNDGAMALSDATLIVQLGQTVIAQQNEAKKDGNAIALLLTMRA